MRSIPTGSAMSASAGVSDLPVRAKPESESPARRRATMQDTSRQLGAAARAIRKPQSGTCRLADCNLHRCSSEIAHREQYIVLPSTGRLVLRCAISDEHRWRLQSAKRQVPNWGFRIARAPPRTVYSCPGAWPVVTLGFPIPASHALENPIRQRLRSSPGPVRMEFIDRLGVELGEIAGWHAARRLPAFGLHTAETKGGWGAHDRASSPAISAFTSSLGRQRRARLRPSWTTSTIGRLDEIGLWAKTVSISSWCWTAAEADARNSGTRVRGGGSGLRAPKSPCAPEAPRCPHAATAVFIYSTMRGSCPAARILAAWARLRNRDCDRW